jgi:2-iminobutanoate/2-iminopropanoate deaminase
MQLHQTDRAPAAIGPYAQAVSIEGWVFTSGQIGLDPETGELASSDFETQVSQVLDNLQSILASAGCGFPDVVKATIYMVDLEKFSRLNELYGRALGDHRPARSTIQVAALPKGAQLEIDMIARIPASRSTNRTG